MVCGRKARFPPVLRGPASVRVLCSALLLLLGTGFVQWSLQWGWAPGYTSAWGFPSSVEVGFMRCSGQLVGGQYSDSELEVTHTLKPDEEHLRNERESPCWDCSYPGSCSAFARLTLHLTNIVRGLAVHRLWKGDSSPSPWRKKCSSASAWGAGTVHFPQDFASLFCPWSMIPPFHFSHPQWALVYWRWAQFGWTAKEIGHFQWTTLIFTCLTSFASAQEFWGVFPVADPCLHSWHQSDFGQWDFTFCVRSSNNLPDTVPILPPKESLGYGMRTVSDWPCGSFQVPNLVYIIRRYSGSNELNSKCSLGASDSPFIQGIFGRRLGCVVADNTGFKVRWVSVVSCVCHKLVRWPPSLTSLGFSVLIYLKMSINNH